MKRVLFLFVIIIFLLVSRVDAKVYNYSCDYSFNTSTGETIKFRIRVKDLDESYIKGKDPSYWNTEKFWNEHVYDMVFINGNYTLANKKTYATKFDGQNKKMCKEFWLLDNFYSKPAFIEKSVDLSKNDIVCPAINWYKESSSQACQLTFNKTYTEECYKCGSDGCYQPYGTDTCVKDYNTSATSLQSLNCYDEKNQAVKCDSVAGNEGIYDKSKKDCIYTANNGSIDVLPYKLIYDPNGKTLQFDDNGWGYTLDPSNSMKEEGGKYYLTDPELLKKFEEASNNNACPTTVKCSCKWGIKWNGEFEGKTCWFNNPDISDGHCGLLTSVDGERSETPGTLPGGGRGTKPSAPNMGFGGAGNCSEILGPNLVKVVNIGITAIQIIGAILAIVYGMISLIPAVMAKDTDGLKQAEKKLVIMAIILLCIFLLRYFIKLLGTIFGFDTSCIA